jgi:hypothetical protein
VLLSPCNCTSWYVPFREVLVMNVSSYCPGLSFSDSLDVIVFFTCCSVVLKLFPLKQRGEIRMYYRIIQKTVEHLNKLEIGCSRFLATAAALPCSVSTLCRCTVTHFQSFTRAEGALALLATHHTLCSY